jgi:hypothetical protein
VLGYGVAVDVVSFVYHRCDGSEEAVSRILLLRNGGEVASTKSYTFKDGIMDGSMSLCILL